MIRKTIPAFFAALCLPAIALAEDPAPAPDPTTAPAPVPAPPPAAPAPAAKSEGGETVAIGLHVGPSIPLSPLKLTVLPRLEIGFMPGGGRLMLFATGSYAAPVASGTIEDPRVAGGSADWTLRQQEVALGAGIAYRLSNDGAPVHPEIALAPQLYLLETRADGDGDGATFGETREVYAQLGGLVAFGVGVDAGPGRVVGRVEAAMSPLVGAITGRSSTTAITPTVGYRLLF